MTVVEIAGLASEGIVCSSDLRRTGMDPRILQRLVADGTLARIRRGCYVDASRWSAARSSERHRLRVLAAGRLMPDAIYSHESAAAIWGLPLVGHWTEAVHVSGAWARGGRSSTGVVWHGSSNRPDGVPRDGVVVTSVARTLVDVSRSRPFASAVVAADHALRSGLTTPGELAAEVDLVGSGRGRIAADLVLAFADPRSESVGESLSRARMRELRLVAPELQVSATDAEGAAGRVDFWWSDVGLVGEFDGRLKYRVGGVVDQRAIEDRVWAEKLREDRIRATGRAVTRWTWEVALAPQKLLAHLRAAGVPLALRRLSC
jgi:hypothetical protein